MRRASILMCLLLGLALPAAALAHGDEPHGVAAARSLRDVAKQCASYSPRQEARLHRVEALVLGPEHAADHARERSEDRRKACTPSGTVRPAFARQLRAKASAKREAAVGPAASVGEWSAGIPLPGIVAIHSTLMPTGKILFFYNNPSFGDEELGRVMVWDPVTKTGVRRDVPANIWCAGQTLLADGRVLVVGGNLQYQTDTTAFKGLNQIWIFDPWTETWTRGPNMRHGRWYPTATRMADGRVLITAGWDESGGGASANNRDIEVYTPAADGKGPGTVQLVGSEDIDYYPHQFQLPDGRVLIAGAAHRRHLLRQPRPELRPQRRARPEAGPRLRLQRRRAAAGPALRVEHGHAHRRRRAGRPGRQRRRRVDRDHRELQRRPARRDLAAAGTVAAAAAQRQRRHHARRRHHRGRRQHPGRQQRLPGGVAPLRPGRQLLDAAGLAGRAARLPLDRPAAARRERAVGRRRHRPRRRPVERRRRDLLAALPVPRRAPGDRPLRRTRSATASRSRSPARARSAGRS